MKQTVSGVAQDKLGPALGKKIAVYRKKKGLTQAALAEAIEVDSETVSRFERGSVLPSLSRLFAIAEVLGVGVGDLLAEASHYTRDVERSLSGVLDEISPKDQKLLLGIAELMRKR